MNVDIHPRIIGEFHPMQYWIRRNKHLFQFEETKEFLIVKIPNVNHKGVELLTTYKLVNPIQDEN